MKRLCFMKRLFYLLFAFIVVVGCDDPIDVGLVTEQLHQAAQPTIPDEVWQVLKKEAEKIEEQVKRVFEIANRPNVPEFWIQRKALLIQEGIADREGNVLIDIHALQKAFYTKYIDAAGIPVVSPEKVEDLYLLAARDAVLLMTSKHPELLDRLQGNFYMVLVADREDFLDIPENQTLSWAIEGKKDRQAYDKWLWFSGTCSFNGYAEGMCYARLVAGIGCPIYIFIHEFAHVLYHEMERLKPGFEEQVREAWKQSVEKFGERVASNSHILSSPGEYWSVGTELWMSGQREWLFEKFPMLAELLAEWYPEVDCFTTVVDLIDFTVNSIELKIIE